MSPATYAKAIVAGCGSLAAGLGVAAAAGGLSAVEVVVAGVTALGAAAAVFVTPNAADDDGAGVGRHAV